MAVATAGPLSYPGVFWTNTSTIPTPTSVAAPLSCLPCTYLQIEPGYATWTPAASIKPLATTQVVVDPNKNTTFTSIKCDTEVLSSYSTRLDLSYTMDESCHLVAKYVGVYGGSGNTTGFQWATVTLTEPTGTHVQMGGNFAAHGELSTTDSSGQPTCISDWNTYYSSAVGVYTDAITTDVVATWTIPVTSIATVDGKAVATTVVSYSTASGGFWLMPALSEYLPGLAAVAQCTPYIIPGGSPMALQPASYIKLPTSTLPRDNPSTTTTATSQNRLSTTKAKTNQDTTYSDPPSQTSRVSAAIGALNTVSSIKPPAGHPDGQVGSIPVVSAIADFLPDTVTTTSEPNALSILAAAAAATFTPQDQHPSAIPAGILAVPGVAKAYVVDQNTISAGGDAVTIGNTVFSALAPTQGVLVAANGVTRTVQYGESASTVRVGDLIIGKIADSVNCYAYGSTTISAGGPALTAPGTVFSALPSDSGILVVANGKHTILPASVLATPAASSGEGYHIGSETALVGGPAITSSGTVYSALPLGSGLVAIAGETTTTLNRHAATNISNIEAVNAVSGAYVLNGGATINAGGSVVSVDGARYSALPSGEGVIVVTAGYTTTIVVPGQIVPAAFSTTTIFVEGSASAVHVTQTRRPPSLVSGGTRSLHIWTWSYCAVIILAFIVLVL